MAITDGFENQFLSFQLRDEQFAVGISKVWEVLDVITLTQIPRMPDYMAGVINLRGSVVPVVDLGWRLGMGPLERTVNSCIIIVEIAVDATEEMIKMGVLTDAVQAVLELKEDDIEDVPKMGTNLNMDFIRGMGRLEEDTFMILLDIDQALASEGEAVAHDMAAGLLTSAAGGTDMAMESAEH